MGTTTTNVTDFKRIALILARLGPDATQADAAAMDGPLSRSHPGVPIGDIPDEVFQWLRSGEGVAPVVILAPASATSLLGIYLDLDEQGRAELLAAAQRLARPPS